MAEGNAIEVEGKVVAVLPGTMFEEMGFSYLGPVDGHDLPKLIDVLQGVKKLKGPILLHVVTKKGRGYEKAEADRMPVSLYMHLPFCESLCLFCACNVIITKDHSERVSIQRKSLSKLK